MRAFIAVEIPGPVKEELKILAEKLARETRGYRFVDPRAVHLTLKFLGDTPPDVFLKIAGIIEAGVAADGPIKLAAAGLGGFPDARSARVVWVGLAGETGKLKTLASKVDQTMCAVGFAPERKPFHPHLTIGRAMRSGKPGGVTEAAAAHGGFAGAGFEVREITLFESILDPSGARHIAHARGLIL